MAHRQRHKGERCEIVVLGAGVLDPPSLFDTVSYGPSSNGNMFTARHDAVGLGTSCATTDCTGEASTSCYVSFNYDYVGSGQDSAPPAGCYAGASGPPPGTVLAAGEVLTWAAAGDAQLAVGSYGAASNRASAHGGWELCFA